MMTDNSEVEKRIQTIIAERLQIDKPAVDKDLFQSGTLDSLSFVDMLVALEEALSIQIPLDRINLDDFRSIVRIAIYVSQQSVNEVVRGKHSGV
jgi:acyl carrier protein